jgi:hypothetical protein
MHFCGNNAHHQNGVAERAIKTISNMARAMILHASMHWKDGIDASLWPMTVVNTSGKAGAQIPHLSLGDDSPPWGR